MIFDNALNISGAIATLVLTGIGIWKFIVPTVRGIIRRRKSRAATEKAVRDVLLGRPPGEPNPITGEDGTPELPGIAERVNTITELAFELRDKVNAMAIEVQSNNATRIIRLEELTEEMRGQLHFLHNQLAESLRAGGYVRPESEPK